MNSIATPTTHRFSFGRYTAVDETAAMASVKAPEIKYKTYIPDGILRSGKISGLQMLAVLTAG